MSTINYKFVTLHKTDSSILCKTNKSRQGEQKHKADKYSCAEEANTNKKISTERTNQGVRARLDRHSAQRKRKKNKDTRNKLSPKQGEQRTRPNLKGKQANAKSKQNRKKQEQKRILKLHAFYHAYSVLALKDGTGLKLKFLI